jgi:hypothetical protein
LENLSNLSLSSVLDRFLPDQNEYYWLSCSDLNISFSLQCFFRLASLFIQSLLFGFPKPIPLQQKPGGRTGFLFLQHAEPEEDRRRVIRHLRSDEPLNFGHTDVPFFSFYGCSVYNLRTQLGIRANQGNIFSTRMCVQAGLYGRLTPLVNDLPHSDELMNIVMFTDGAPGEDFAVFLIVCVALVICLSPFQEVRYLKFSK